jgi:hypothetical protein
MEIHFTEALAGTINVVLYAEFDNVIEIGRNKLWIRISHKGRRYV